MYKHCTLTKREETFSLHIHSLNIFKLNFFKRFLKNKFLLPNTVRGDNKKKNKTIQHPELWSLHATHLFNLMYNSTINVSSMALKLWQSHGFHWQILSGEWTQKLQYSKLQFLYTTNLLTSCSILPSTINIFQRVLDLQGLYYQILTGDIPKKLQYLEL